MVNFTFNDLTDKRFGRLVVVSKTSKRQHRKIIWRCRCDCGNYTEVLSTSLVNGRTQSCGCLHHDTVADMMSSDLKGQRFGRLVVIAKTEQRKHRKIIWLCRCACGSEIEVPTNYLVSGDTKSCGCLRDDVQGDKNPNWRGGISTEANLVRTSKEYQDWRLEVFRRDGFRCQKCKRKAGGDLVAHHIKGFRAYEHLRFALSNGIALCTGCHLEFHKKHSFHYCDGDNFYKWINE